MTHIDERNAEIASLRVRVKELEELLSAAKQAIPEDEYPASGTITDWAWQVRRLGEDRRAAYRRMEKAERELAELKASLDLDAAPMPGSGMAAFEATRRHERRCIADALETWARGVSPKSHRDSLLDWVKRLRPGEGL